MGRHGFVFAITMFLSLAPLALQASSECSALFQLEKRNVATRPLQFSNVTERNSLFELASDFNRLPSVDRTKTPHPAFTAVATDLLTSLEGELTHLRGQFSGLSSGLFRDRAQTFELAAQELKVTRAKIEASTTQMPLTEKQLFSIAFDFVKIQSLLHERQPEFANLWAGLLDDMTVIPTVRDHSLEDSLKLLSLGVQVLHLPRFTHASPGLLTSELQRVQVLGEMFYSSETDRVSLPYLRDIIQSLEKMPDDRRRAGFAALYLAFFKYPQRYLPTIPTTPPTPGFATAQSKMEIINLMERMKADFIFEIGGQSEIAAVLKPGGFLKSQRAEIAEIAESGLLALRTAMISAQKPPWSQLSAREKLIEVANEFNPLPIEKRAKLRHRAFTETVDDVFRELETVFHRYSVGLTPEHRMALQFGREYFDLLKNETDRMSEGGEINMRWAVHVGAHAARVSDILTRDTKNLVLMDWYRHDKELRAYARLRSENKETKALIREAFGNTAELANRQISQFLVVPSTHMFSPEGVVELIAHGVHTLGFFAKSQHSGLNGRKYYDHDRGHVAGFYTALSMTIRDLTGQYAGNDLTSEPVYLEFKKRLQFMCAYLKSQSIEERKAGFAVLFYAVHEQPTVFLKYLMEPFDLKRIGTLRSYLDMATDQMRDSTDLGFSFPRKWWGIFNRYSVKNPEKISKLGADLVMKSLEEYHRSQGLKIDR